MCIPFTFYSSFLLFPNTMASSGIPDEWYCPIGRELMTDPVIGPDGVTYERVNIERWLQTNSTSPITREHMPSRSLIPNMALKHTIVSYLSANPDRVGTVHVMPTAPPFRKHPLTIRGKTYEGKLIVEIEPPRTAERQPICFIAILDNSGSMGESASMAQGTESFGFTRMDLTKHASHTIVETLQPHDMFALVTFSTDAKIVLRPTLVSAANKNRIKSAIDSIQPDANTNIYDGICKATELANHPDMTGRHIVAMMMTDGYPNISPPRGIVPTLANLRITNPWTLHTFGFGYNIDSSLLEGIAKWGNGLFGFIPDCSMVGTVFINFLAHMLSVVVPTATLSYKLIGGVEETVSVGPIISGQTRTLVIPIPPETSTPIEIHYDGSVCMAEPGTPDQFTRCYDEYKSMLQTFIRGSGTPARECTAFIEKYAVHDDSRIAAILRDIQSDTEGEGQIGLAVNPEFFERWGKHYIRAYLRSQELQQCMNFKDPGLQMYGGDLFHAIQTEADTIFCTLPPPKASGAVSSGYGGAATTAPLLASMSVFHNASSGCFHGDNQIRMGDGSSKKIRDVTIGDIVKTPTGTACVRYTVECRSHARSQPMTQYGELSITPWHPIRSGGIWKFPADIASYTSRLVNVVHNFVLDRDHIVIVGGVECCTLAHGFKGPVIEHDYFGANVLQDLRMKANAESGHVMYENLKTVRDPKTDMIIGWIDAP